MSEKYILAFDQGTTSSRAILFNKNGEAAGQWQRPHEQIYPEPGWVSHNPKEIFFNIVECAKRAMESVGASPVDIAAIGITNQRETLVAWDKRNGEPACDAIVWQCRRTADLCRQARTDGMEDALRRKTGLLIDPYFSATKIRWTLDNIPRARALLEEGNLIAGTIDSWLIWNLTGGARHVTDYTNASRTMLFNIHTLKWDEELLDYFKIPVDIMPEVIPSNGYIGATRKEHFGEEIPITGVAGDQHAALFGQTCFNTGDVKNTYGTGCFILKNIGEQPIISSKKLLTTIAWHIDGQTVYAMEGSIFNAGAAVEWMMKEARLADDVNEINEICDDTPDTQGVYMTPAFSGLGAPFWDMDARGIICGLSLSSNRKHIVRAVMESIAFQSKAVIDAMEDETGLPMSRLRVDGGVSKSRFVMQFQSDILNIPVERPKVTETTALGAAYLAGLAVGFYKDLEDISRNHIMDEIYEPAMDGAVREERYRMWLKAVERAKDWAGGQVG
ncbi:MAG: glycerol kinase GlpK [Clostridiales bacterium]|jgi:glycerol kinase|nr:glycerol kinase GlpK [Clostridiales bacterium]